MFVITGLGFRFFRIMLILRAFVSLLLERGHLLMVLILLEAIILGLFSYLVFRVFRTVSNLYLCLAFIRFVACEAAVGLSLLVSLIRTHGNDFVSSLTVYEC